MIRYVLKRLLWMIPILIGVTLIVTILLDLTPGDPARQLLGNFATEEQIEALRVELGLNKPLIVRYLKFMAGVLKGNLGISYFTHESVTFEISRRFPYTLLLVVISMLIAIITGIPTGVYAATHQYTWKDNMSIVLSLFCVSMPSFWFALILVQIFSTKLGWLPSLGIDPGNPGSCPPSRALSATLRRSPAQTRSSMLEQIRQDYVVTARAKGQTERKVIYKHALKTPSYRLSLSLAPCSALPSAGRSSRDDIRDTGSRQLHAQRSRPAITPSFRAACSFRDTVTA